MSVNGVRALGSRYELIERIGSGAMGEVWRAWDQKEKTEVAAKLMHRHFARDVDVVGRFIRERSILVSLHHPNIVEIVDLVVEGDDLALVMEFVEGGNLGAYRRAVGTMSAQMAVSTVCGILAGLAFAHERGVLHRDIKPDNVLLAGYSMPGEGTVLLSDFGIARLSQETTVQATGLLGTPYYMPPELFESGIFSQLSDVYATGIVLYELLAGRTPFEGGLSPLAVGMRHVVSMPPRLPVNDRLWRIIEVMLSKDPKQRLTAAGTLRALRALPETILEAAPLPVQPPVQKWEDISSTKAVVGGVLHVSTMDGDVGQTFVPSVQSDSSPLAVAGSVKALIPGEGASLDGATMLGISAPSAADPALESQAPASPVKKRPKWWVFVLAGVAVVALIVTGILWATGVFTRGELGRPVVSYQPGHVIGTQLPSGLRIDYEAAPEQTANNMAVRLTVKFTAAKESGVAGDILVVFPQEESGQCPSVEAMAWSSTVSPVTPSNDGVNISCGYKVPLVLLASETQDLRLIVSGVQQEDLGAWLTALKGAGDEALRDITGSLFALQRISGIRVVPQGVSLGGGTPAVPYSVFPVWAGQTPDEQTSELFRYDTLDYQASDLLLQLTGNRGFAAVTVTSCSSAQVTGHRVIAEQPIMSCVLEIRVGSIAPAQSSFAIRLGPS